jgi:hypothetical protein
VRIVLEARLGTRCNACSYLTPLPGLRHAAECAKCAAAIDVAAKIRSSRDGGLTYAFGGYFDAMAESLLYDQDHDFTEDYPTPLALRSVKRFLCHCGAPLDAPAPNARDVRCAACGDATPVRWPDEQTREWDPRIAYLIGDAGERGVSLKQKLEGTVVACGACGAPLEQRGDRRALVCSHCRAENLLSDAIWTKLHPRPEDHTFYLVYELDQDGHADAVAWLVMRCDADEELEPRIAEIQAKARDRVLAACARRALAHPKEEFDVDVAGALVARPDLDDAAMESIDRRLTTEQREAVVTHATAAFISRWIASQRDSTREIGAKRAAGADIEACAKDRYRGVRAAIAQRTDVPAEIVAALRKDDDATVRELARKNPSYQPGLLTKLFGG